MGRPPGIEYQLVRMVNSDGPVVDGNCEKIFFGYAVEPDEISPRDFGLDLIHADDRLDRTRDTVYVLQLAGPDGWVDAQRFRLPGRLPLPARMSAEQLQTELSGIGSAS